MRVEQQSRIERAPVIGAFADNGYGLPVNIAELNLSNLVKLIKKWAQIDASRFDIWIPVFIGAGVAFYFSLLSEPDFWIAPVFLLSQFFLSKISHAFRYISKILFWASLGFIAADMRTSFVNADTIESDLSPRLVVGHLLSVGEADNGRRLLIDVEAIRGVAHENLPSRVRVTWRGKEFDASPGEKISIRAGLSPPPEPVAPGAFDYARYLYFEKIGGVGFAVSPPRVLSDNDRGYRAQFAAKVERVRLYVARRILEAAPDQGGAIVAAVTTGKRDAISEPSKQALRDAGLAHLLAISGLHMGLATGLIFFFVRGLLASSQTLALNFPIKKWAAALALLSGFAYLILSGAGWSARRAFVMTSVIFFAVMIDRRALSLRNVAIAATLILMISPEAILHPGFQMSFAAATALIASYEWAANNIKPPADYSLPARMKRYGIGLAVTDTVAALATAPFGLFHFNRVAIYSLPANIAAMPLMAFWIMPLIVLALLLTPFGLDQWAWQLSAAGMNFVLDVASWVSSRPGAIEFTPQWPMAALTVITIGGLWLCLMKAKWRYAGFAAIPISMFVVASVKPPDIFIARKGDNVGVVVDENTKNAAIAIFDRRKNRFDRRAWQEFAGLDEAADGVSFKEIGQCDQYGCTLTKKGFVIAVSKKPMGLIDDCARASLVIATYPVSKEQRKACANQLVDRRSAWNNGAQAIWIDDLGQIRIKNVASFRGQRPWVN